MEIFNKQCVSNRKVQARDLAPVHRSKRPNRSHNMFQGDTRHVSLNWGVSILVNDVCSLSFVVVFLQWTADNSKAIPELFSLDMRFWRKVSCLHEGTHRLVRLFKLLEIFILMLSMSMILKPLIGPLS